MKKPCKFARKGYCKHKDRLPEGIVVVARRTELKPTNYGGVDLTTYFRPDQLDQLYSDTTLFMRLTPLQEGEAAAKKGKR